MQITIHRADLEHFVAEKVASGEYPSPDAVVEDALARLETEEADGGWTTEELRNAVDTGLEQLARGEGIELKDDRELDAFFEDIKRAGRERMAE